MKTNKVKWLSLLLLFITTLFFVSCNDDDDSNDSARTSKVNVRLTDAPGDYDEVNVEVLDVMIKTNLDTGDDGWISIGNVTPQVYNLLDLTGGLNVLLAGNATVPSGSLGQIRLLLGDDNTVVKDGVSYPLRTPSAQQSGLKIKVNTTLQPDITYDFMLDFDVNQSVVVEAGGSGNYNLNPVIRVTTNANTGIIKGMVTTTPVGVAVLASVQVNGLPVSAFTDAEGNFQINGVPAGTYALTLTPDAASGLAVVTVENVVVVNGEVTDVGAHILL
ncbi:DUF4382 domain-containing protein [Flavobacterium sp.]|uniref:DUF4382 domain-containing protein n=1 Tax=Flavobacterium sp. TaxID=239 RepID=UPI002613C163|nr:DUF4382 domain-containing protein [Flavobacterium sp.]